VPEFLGAGTLAQPLPAQETASGQVRRPASEVGAEQRPGQGFQAMTSYAASVTRAPVSGSRSSIRAAWGRTRRTALMPGGALEPARRFSWDGTPVPW